jgi:hypothetical protein
MPVKSPEPKSLSRTRMYQYSAPSPRSTKGRLADATRAPGLQVIARPPSSLNVDTIRPLTLEGSA